MSYSWVHLKFSYLTKHIHVIYYSYVHPKFLGKNVHKYQFIFIFLCVVILDIEENYIKKIKYMHTSGTLQGCSGSTAMAGLGFRVPLFTFSLGMARKGRPIGWVSGGYSNKSIRI